MGLTDVDREERDPVPIAVGQSVERPYLGAEGRSGIRAEDERDRPLGEEVVQAQLAAALELR